MRYYLNHEITSTSPVLKDILYNLEDRNLIKLSSIKDNKGKIFLVIEGANEEASKEAERKISIALMRYYRG